MGIGYQVAPLHRLIVMNTAELHTRPAVRGENPLFDVLKDASGRDVHVADGPLRMRSPSIESILAWRQRIATKYRDQLDEDLTWDEGSTYESSDDVATSGDVMFHFAAALLDQQGQRGLSSMIQQRHPTTDEMTAAFANADRRGFGGRFPQLLLGAQLWLPFSRNLMIEEPNWDGAVERYGSVPRLLDEVTEIRAAIAEADPSVEQSTEQEALEHSLAAAWQVSDTVLRLVALASEKHLPLWTTD
jgi:hypothetical protein